jgi:5-methylcytosine-specific restriction enzyme subunit McrC
LCFHFPDIKEIPVNKSSFDKVNLNRKTETYSEAINIARMLILNYSPDISRGQDDMLAILFDMNLLWEKYIYKRLKQGESGRYRVNYQEGKRFWNHRLIRPDLVIRKDKETIILDTKWRLAEANNPSDDELKQMYAYNMYWDARKAILLYPKTGDKKEEDFGKFYKGINGEHLCKVGFVDVLDENGELNMGVAEDVLEKIN